MRIVLDEDFIIESSTRQITLYKRKQSQDEDDEIDEALDVAKEDEYRPVAYGMDLESILKSYVRRRLYMSNATTLAELVQEIKALNERVARLAKGETE